MGTVYSSGIPAQAVALENSSVRLRGNLTESATAVVNTLRGKASASEHFAVETSGRATVSFSPALGLFPNNLSLPTWNSSSAYTASGSWSIQTSFATVPFFGAPASSSRVYPGSFSDAQGTVAVVGSTDGPRTLANGQLTTQVLLSVSGPFTSWEGFILLPNGSDLLSSSSAPWDTDPVGAQIALPQTIDVQDPSAVGHLPILASATRYQPSATDSGAVSLDSGVTSALTGVGSSGGNGTALMDGPGASTIQAQPESVPAAEKSSNCLISGCGSAGAGLRVDRGLVLGIAIVVVGVVIAAVVVMRQPPRPNPPLEMPPCTPGPRPPSRHLRPRAMGTGSPLRRPTRPTRSAISGRRAAGVRPRVAVPLPCSEIEAVEIAVPAIESGDPAGRSPAPRTEHHRRNSRPRGGEGRCGRRGNRRSGRWGRWGPGCRLRGDPSSPRREGRVAGNPAEAGCPGPAGLAQARCR